MSYSESAAYGIEPPFGEANHMYSDTGDGAEAGYGTPAGEFGGDAMPDRYADTGILNDHVADSAVTLPMAEQFDIPPFVEMKTMEPHEVRAAEQRAGFFSEVGHLNADADLAVDQIHHFARALGLASSEHMVVAPGNIKEVVAALKRTGLADDTNGDVGGEYHASLGIGVVYLGEPKVPLWSTEQTLTHETVGHGSVGIIPHGFLSPQAFKEILLPRTAVPFLGFKSHTQGAFLEEGFSTVVDNEYVRYAGPESLAQRSTDERGTVKHLYNQTYEYYTDAAIGWAVLCAADPEITDPLFNSRADAGARQEVMHRIDAIRPGLAAKLLGGGLGTAGYAPRIFSRALTPILRATRMSRDEVPDICDDGPLMQYVAKKLATYEAQHNYRFQRNDTDM